MISLDQVVLLQRKVEAAVAKIKSLSGEIEQLSSENDALRRKCAELTNALADKSGLVSSLEAEQNQIEQSILTALDQLDAVEDSVLSTVAAEESLDTVPEGQVNEGSSVVAEAENHVQGSVVLNESSVEKSPEPPVESQATGSVEFPATKPRVLDPLANSSSYVSENSFNNGSAQGNVGSGEEKPEANQFDIF